MKKGLIGSALFGGVRRIEGFLRTPKVCLAFPFGEGGPFAREWWMRFRLYTSCDVIPYTFGDSMHACGVIPYQSFGSDRKKALFAQCFFLANDYNFDTKLAWVFMKKSKAVL